jgi:hypothetical protein
LSWRRDFDFGRAAFDARFADRPGSTAPTDRAFILALHHPIYSFDVYQLQDGGRAGKRDPRLRPRAQSRSVGPRPQLKRIEQTIAKNSATPFIVTGNGGYHDLHKIHVEEDGKAPDTGAMLKYFTDKRWGFMTLTIDKKKISGVTIEVDRNGQVHAGDSFSYPAAPIHLENPKSVPTL